MTSNYPPIILDGKILNEGLTELLTAFASDLSTEFSIPMLSKNEIQSLTSTLTTYLGFFVSNKLRRSTTALDPDNLEFSILRSRNAAEEYKDDKGKYVKGEKKWYRLVLHETTVIEAKTDVQILAEGEISLNKGDVLTGFGEALKKKNEKWTTEDKARVTKHRRESALKAHERKKAEDGGGEKKGGSSGEGKGKGKEKAMEIITIDDDSEEEEDEE